MKPSLADIAKAYLMATKGRWPTVARESGVDKEWIYKFMAGKIHDPGVYRTEKLIEHAERSGWKYGQPEAA